MTVVILITFHPYTLASLYGTVPVGEKRYVYALHPPERHSKVLYHTI